MVPPSVASIVVGKGEVDSVNKAVLKLSADNRIQTTRRRQPEWVELEYTSVNSPSSPLVRIALGAQVRQS